MTLKILACQINIPALSSVTEREQNLQRTTELVGQQLNDQQADLVVLPELSSIDYSRRAFANIGDLSEPDDGSSYKAWSQVALSHGCWIIYGFARRTSGGFAIATAIVDPAGRLAGVYEKLHLAQFGDSMEKEYFLPGSQGLLIAEINGFRVAPIICYDIRAPELCRTLVVDHHVDFIVHTGAYARDPSFYSWHAFATTRAVENQVYLLSLNRAGEQFGHSAFCTPWIDEQHPLLPFDPHREQCEIFTLDKSVIRDARTRFSFLKDRLGTYNLKTTVVS